MHSGTSPSLTKISAEIDDSNQTIQKGKFADRRSKLADKKTKVCSRRNEFAG